MTDNDKLEPNLWRFWIGGLARAACTGDVHNLCERNQENEVTHFSHVSLEPET